MQDLKRERLAAGAMTASLELAESRCKSLAANTLELLPSSLGGLD